MAGAASPSTRLFDLDEAQRMLPLVRSIVKGLLDDYAERQALVERLPAVREEGDDGAARALEREAEALSEKVLEAVAEIEELGAEFKGVEPALVDFPTMRDGEIAYLCWRFDEERIGWWHPVDAGYGGRRPIETD